MPDINVDGLVLCFPDGWQITKFDDWDFYRNQFSRAHNKIKAVDVLAISPDNSSLWMIEVKDFRVHQRKKTYPLYEEIWEKVFSTLAALLPAQTNAIDKNEKNFAKIASQVSNIRVIFQGEQPVTNSTVFSQSYNVANLQKKFKRLFQAIDSSALVINSSKMPDCIPWTVKL
ncbi:hypothetical protein [uncultured Mailhella sp.]|uniref:hypothetical protein n=1 Tax=uncultured Mailhella sp. TaxID=1981031 RepID=UPI0025DCC392|nr:hypothetical protein [uncultured Mailhella sp.]